MNFLNFVLQYPDKPGCRKKFKEYRDRTGVVCLIAEAKNITGKKTGCSTNAKNTGNDRP
jgi:hypothetical protein